MLIAGPAIWIGTGVAQKREIAAMERRKVELAPVAAKLGFEYLPEDKSILGWFSSVPFYP